MAAKITRLRTRKNRLTDIQAEAAKQALLDLDGEKSLPYEELGKILVEIDKRTSTRRNWTFVMISPDQNAEVVTYLNAHSKRPRQAVELWAQLFRALRTDTGEIVLRRDELAKIVDIPPKRVSEIMSELEGINAISRRRDGRGVRYFMNPNVGTHLAGREREEAQAKASQISIFDVIEGGVA